MDVRRNEDRVGNEHIRGTTRVMEASEKVTEKRLKWYGQIIRREEDVVRSVRGGNTREKERQTELGGLQRSAERRAYRTVIRPAMLYGAETQATTKGQEAREDGNGMRMLR